MMYLPWPEPLRAFQDSVMVKLKKGKGSATQLQTLLEKVISGGDRASLVSAEELTLQISRSFTDTITMLSSCGVNEIRDQILATDATTVDKVSSRGRSSKTSDHSRNRLGLKDRRGCYRRRNVSHTRVHVSPTVEDGHAWRKYGQKEILNANFPRCYFRCTHKRDQGCKATKQVQRIQDDPLMYQTTYFGHHTCQQTLIGAPQIIPDSDPMESCLLSFETKTPTKQDSICPKFALITPTGAPWNQEFKEETQSDVSDTKSCLDSSPTLQNLLTNSASSSGPKSSKIDGANYHEEVVSSVPSCSSTPLNGLAMEAFDNEFPDLDDDLYLIDNMVGFFQENP